MSKKILGAFLALFFVSGVALTTYAAPVSASSPDTVSVHGKITNYATGKPVHGARVQISCNGSLVATSAPTDSNGDYIINVPADRCPIGGDLVVTVTIDDLSGLAVSTIKDDNTISIPLQKTVHVAEYGWVGGIAASSAGIGTIAFVRRQQKKQGARL